MYCTSCTVPHVLYLMYCTSCTVPHVLYLMYCTSCTVPHVLYLMYCTSCTVGDAQVFLEGPPVESVCYGNTISLICSYPTVMERINGMPKYLTTRNGWAVNGTTLIPDGITSSSMTVNSTAQRLYVNLTREQFGVGIHYYSCFLDLYNSTTDSSNEVGINPPGK